MYVGVANESVTGKTSPAFPAHVQTAILRIWQEAHAQMVFANSTVSARCLHGHTALVVRWPHPQRHVTPVKIVPWVISYGLEMCENKMMHALSWRLFYVLNRLFALYFPRCSAVRGRSSKTKLLGCTNSSPFQSTQYSIFIIIVSGITGCMYLYSLRLFNRLSGNRIEWLPQCQWSIPEWYG